MSEQERKEQEKHRSYLLDLTKFYDVENVNNGNDTTTTADAEDISLKCDNNGEEAPVANGASNGVKKTGKMASLFEIQNTLDDASELVCKNGNGNGLHHNGHNNNSSRLYVADTESESEASDGDEEAAANKSGGTHLSNKNKSHLNNTSGCGEFHLEMSESLIGDQSSVNVSTTHLGKTK